MIRGEWKPLYLDHKFACRHTDFLFLLESSVPHLVRGQRRRIDNQYTDMLCLRVEVNDLG